MNILNKQLYCEAKVKIICNYKNTILSIAG